MTQTNFLEKTAKFLFDIFKMANQNVSSMELDAATALLLQQLQEQSLTIQFDKELFIEEVMYEIIFMFTEF